MASPSPSRASHRSTDPPDPAPPDISETRPSPFSPPPSPVSPSSAPVAFHSPSASSFDAIAHQLQKSSIPAEIPAAAAPSYAERFKSSLRNLRKISSPTYLEDGTPVVQAPESVLLYTSDLWKDHIIAHFHGSIPPARKIFDDLNPVWGKFGKITIRIISATSCLIYVPSLQTREWVVQVGYWQAGHCAFSAFAWSPDANLAPQELTSAPTWVILKNVPPQLYSLDGITVIASGIGEPLHTEHSRLDPYHFGDTKVKVEIDLGVLSPEVIEVRDSLGHSVQIRAQYTRLPPKCCNCDRFGHFLNRCPLPPQKKKHQENALMARTRSDIATVNTKVSLEDNNPDQNLHPPPINTSNSGPSKTTLRRRKSRSRSRARNRARSLGPIHTPVHATSSDLNSVESEADVNGELNGPVTSNGDMKQVVSEDVTRTDMQPPMLRPDILPDSNEEFPLSNGDSKISEHLDYEEDLSNQSSGEEVPWQTKLSKKAKRIQEKGNQWQTPAGSVSKALRFGFRVQGSSLVQASPYLIFNSQ